jgi:two-component system OmpR family sensor kinase
LAYSLAHDVDAALQGVACVLAEQPAAGGSPPLPAEIDALFRRFFGFFPWERYAERRQPWGEREPRGSPSRAGKLPLSAEALKRAAQGLPTFETLMGLGPYQVRVLTQPVFEAGRVVSVVQVGMSLESMAVARRRFLWVMAGVLPLARRALKPVEHMAEAARRISAERLDERIQTSGSDDELDRLAHTLNDMLGRLDAAFHQVRQFSADASHELQTPLTILKGELEVALRTPRSPEEYRRVLTSALEECERLVRLVDGLLLLARADAGVLRLDRQPVALDQLVAEVFEHAQILAEPHAVNLCLGPIEPLTVQGDGEHLRRLL